MVRSVGQGLCFVQWFGTMSWVLRVRINGFVAFFGLQWLSVVVVGEVLFLAKAMMVGGGVGFYLWQYDIAWCVCEGKRRRSSGG